MTCQALLLTAQLLFSDASMHHANGRYVSEYNEMKRAIAYMKAYRKCVKDER